MPAGVLVKASTPFLLCALLAPWAAGCIDDPLIPSEVESLRILGLTSTPTDAIEGQTMSLDMLWTDPPPPCAAAGVCPPGRTCREGFCEREGPTEIAWLVLSLAALEASEDVDISAGGFGGEECMLERCPPPTPCSGDEDCLLPGITCREGFCVPCFSFGPVTFCCGGAELDRVDVPIPVVGAGPRDCSDSSALDLAELLQIQVQVCAGGQLDLCIEPGATTFECVGEGAETRTAQARRFVEAEVAEPNEHPATTAASLSESDWSGEETLEVAGCLEEGCADRRCDGDGACSAGQSCTEGICREAVELTLGPTAFETYVEECDDLGSCEEDADCGFAELCEEGLCRRVEEPIVSFFATAGSLSPGRATTDDDADGRPDRQTVETTWTPPVLDECSSSADPCTFGRCDPAAGRCVGEVGLWAVLRDGRGGQSWLERTLRVVP